MNPGAASPRADVRIGHATASPPRAECRIDLGALRHNIGSLAGRLAQGTKFWAVVKANAYGHDVEHVAQVAIASGVKRLCVATLSEAWQLRQAGIRVPLLVMGPLDASSLRRAADLDVSVTVLSATMLDALDAFPAQPSARFARVHLKVDSGMGRWGIPATDAAAALDRIEGMAGVEIEGVMTHFATADEVDDRSFLLRQIDTFDDVVALARQRHPGIVAHAANSAALVADERAHYDAVRCGVAMYGLSPTQTDPADLDLRPVLSLRSYVADVRQLHPGDSVGYGRTFVASHPTRVALVPIGYADGVRRSLSNRADALVRGCRYRFAGTVSMDHCSLLLEGDSADSVRVGDVVTLLGRDGDEQVLAEEHARIDGTINYEITCGIAGEPRLRRVHPPGA